MNVEYSDELKQEIENEIERTRSLIGRLEDKVKGLTAFLDNRVIEGHPEPKEGQRRGRPKKQNGQIETASITQEGRGHRGRKATDMSPEAQKKREYQRRWRESKRATGLGSQGKIAKMPVNRFTLEREFGIDDKDIGLVISYLISWKATGRLTTIEGASLDNIQGISKENLSQAQRSNLRDAFYAARGRVMAGSKKERSSELSGIGNY